MKKKKKKMCILWDLQQNKVRHTNITLKTDNETILLLSLLDHSRRTNIKEKRRNKRNASNSTTTAFETLLMGCENTRGQNKTVSHVPGNRRTNNFLVKNFE